MSEVKVIKHFTKFIFPFTYDRAAVNAKSASVPDKKGNPRYLYEPISIKPHYLRDGLDELLDKDGGATSIAECYRVSPNLRSYFDLPSHSGKALNFYCRNDKDNSYEVAIDSVQVYLFESGVGFVDLECVFKDCDLDKFLSLNYFIGEAKSENNRFEWNDVRRDAEGNEVVTKKCITVQGLVNKIAKSLSVNANPDDLKFNFYNAKQMIYSHVLLSEKPSDLDKLLFHVTKNYKESYKFSGEAAISTMHPFENSYWSSSMNGAVNVSYLTEDEVTNAFFENDFIAKLHSTYFFLFLSVLHQKHSIELMLSKMGELDSLVQDYEIMHAQLKKAELYEAEAHNLKFRSFFGHPSNVEHINDYYDMLKKTLKIDVLYSNFKNDLESLQGICKRYVDRISAREAKFAKIRMIRAEIFVAVLGSLVGEFSLLNTSWGLIEKFVGHEVSFFSPQMLLVVATLLVPLVTIFFSVKKMIIEVYQIRKELCEERKDKLVEDDKLRRRKSRKNKNS